MNKVKKEDDDDIEVYYDLDDQTEQEVKPNKKAKDSKASWVYVNNLNQEGKQLEYGESKKVKPTDYDIDARNPLFANADREEIWELALISNHFHPTVKLFTTKILSKQNVEYDGNPLDDFSTKHFLDRFVFRNPKRSVQNGKVKSTNIQSKVFGRKTVLSSIPFGLNEMVELPESLVPVNEQFIYRFLKQKKKLRLNEKDADDNSDIESVDSFEFNDILDNYENYEKDDIHEDIDFAKNYRENLTKRKNSKRKKKQEIEDTDNDYIDADDADFDEEFDDDMFSDKEFDNDDDEQFESNEDDDEDFSEGNINLDLDKGIKKANKAPNAAPFAGKKGFSKITNDIFQSADEFAHILQENESDSDFDLGNEEEDDNIGFSRKKGGKDKKNFNLKRKRPSLGRKASLRKKTKYGKLELDRN